MKRLMLMLAFVLLASVGAHARKGPVNLVFIGNSITYGALHQAPEKTAPPILAAQKVAKKTGVNTQVRNCGRSGATTVDFLPALNRDFRRVKRAVEELKANDGRFVFSIMLGTNDSASTGPTGAPVSNDDYKQNLLTIIKTLREMCPDAIFVLQRPVWYSPNTYNNARYLVAGLNRMTNYLSVLAELANENGDIYLGDCASYDLFKIEYKKLMFAEAGNAGTFYLHPNEEGSKKMAKNWAKAIVSAMKASQR